MKPIPNLKFTKRHGGWEYQRLGKLRQDCVPDVTPEAKGHVGTALDGLIAGNTVNCGVVNNVHVPNAPGLPRTGYVVIMKADLAATTGPDMTWIGVTIGALMSL